MMEEKRKALAKFCAEHDACIDCPVNIEGHKCGAGYSFRLGMQDDVYITDAEVEKEEKPSKREEILREAIKCVCTDRNQQYGEPEDSFRMIGDLWGRYIAEKCVKVYEDEDGAACANVKLEPEDVAMMMVLFKVCRGATGEKITRDTLVDIAGYAACAGGMIGNE